MVLDLDEAIKIQEREINKSVLAGKLIPKDKIAFYNDLLNANLGGEINNIDSDSAIAQGLQKQFIPGTDTATAAVLKNEPGSLIAGVFTNLNTTDTRYLLLYEQNTVPMGADVPLLSLILPPNGAYEFKSDFISGGTPFEDGIAWAFSTNPNSYTAASAANKVLSFFYI